MTHRISAETTSAYVLGELHFTAIVKGIDTIDADVVEQLYARCDDAAAGICEGIGHVRLNRPANSLNEAIASAIADLCACGLEIEKIEIEPNDLKEVVSATS
jgi:hypothetical protein